MNEILRKNNKEKTVIQKIVIINHFDDISEYFNK